MNLGFVMRNVLLSGLLKKPSLSFLSNPIIAGSSISMANVAGSSINDKKSLRTKVRRALKEFNANQRSNEDMMIQNIVLESPWFKCSKALCAYISCESLREVDTSRILAEILKNPSVEHETLVNKKLYVPRVEDKNSHMRMLNISRTEDLIANSMNILEPSPINADGSEREDVMLASRPINLLLLPGLAFDRQGRRLGRGGGYYDVFLAKYLELVAEQHWKKPLLVALAYSVQMLEDNVIPMTTTDVPVDAIVCATGVVPISQAALEKM